MKHYLNSDQTMRLKALGFPSPKSVSKLSLDWDMDTVPTFNYSIGELLSFIPEKIESEEDDYSGYLLFPTYKNNEYFVLWYKC